MNHLISLLFDIASAQAGSNSVILGSNAQLEPPLMIIELFPSFNERMYACPIRED